MKMDGYFNPRGEPVIRLDAGSSSIEVLVDTGSNAGLLIPDQMAEGLDIKRNRGLEELYTATGEMFLASSCSMEIRWLGKRVRVPVATCAEVNEAILGGQMLKDCCLTIDYGRRTVTIVES